MRTKNDVYLGLDYLLDPPDEPDAAMEDDEEDAPRVRNHSMSKMNNRRLRDEISFY